MRFSPHQTALSLCLATLLAGCAASDPKPAPEPAPQPKKRVVRDDLRPKNPPKPQARAAAAEPTPAPKPPAEAISISFSAEEEAEFARQAETRRLENERLEAERAQAQAAQAQARAAERSDPAFSTERQVIGAAFAQAREQNKMVVLNFYAEWCGYCKQMAGETMTDPGVKRWLDDNVVMVSIDIDHHKALAESARVEGVPTLISYSTAGTETGRLRGFADTNKFLAWGRDAERAK